MDTEMVVAMMNETDPDKTGAATGGGPRRHDDGRLENDRRHG